MFKLDKQTLDEIAQGFHIPAKPQALTDLQNLRAEADLDLFKAAKIVASDVELAGVILKTINSSFFGLPRKVADIKDATIALGMDNIFQITTACMLKNAFFPVQHNSCLSLGRFWDEAIEAAMLCNKLAKDFAKHASTADAYALGLFHDCGVAAMSIRYERYQQALDVANQSQTQELDEIEDRMFGMAHTIVGFSIASSWSIPEYICDIVARHHDKNLLETLAQPKQRELAAILFLAQNVIAKSRNGRERPMWFDVKQATFDTLNITNDDYVAILANQ